MTADEIREFVYRNYIEPARKKRKSTVTVRAGDVHVKMGLKSRIPAVCGAIGTDRFQQDHDIQLIKRDGPTNGANVYFTFTV